MLRLTIVELTPLKKKEMQVEQRGALFSLNEYSADALVNPFRSLVSRLNEYDQDVVRGLHRQGIKAIAFFAAKSDGYELFHLVKYAPEHDMWLPFLAKIQVDRAEAA